MEIEKLQTSNPSESIPTADMSREAWLEARRGGIGGSDAGAIAGLNPYKSAVDVYLEKVGLISADRGNALTEFGSVFEPAVAAWWEKHSGMKCRQDHKIRRHKKYPFILGNLDRLIVPKNGEGSGILEIKTTSRRVLRDAEMDGMQVPAYWVAQIQHYMMVTGHAWGEFAILVCDDRILERVPVQADAEFQSAMLEAEIEFWERHVLTGVAPEPRSGADVISLHPKSNGNSITASSEMENRIKDIKKLKEQRSNLDNQIESEEEAIKISMMDAESMIGSDGRPVATWKSYESKRFDASSFREENPDLYAKYEKTTSSRRFLLK